MSVVGIDFGNDSCYVAIARQGGIETVDNDYSLRATPSCVGFGEKQRILGVAAKNQLITNLSNTVYDFKRFVGRKYDDPSCRNLATGRTYKVVPTESGQAGVAVNYLGAEKVFSFDQVAGMLLTKLKETTEHSIRTKVLDCVVSCPSYFTNVERESILDACQFAGLNVLRLLNDTTASALTYVFYRQDLPEEPEPPRNVIFVDCGHSALQVFACAFNKGKLKMLATASDPYLGGRDFDNVLARHFVEEFKKKYKLDAATSKRAQIRLLAEVEKLKKQMSANSTVLPLNIESFMNDVDVSATMCRADFEALCAPLLERVEKTLLKCLNYCGLQVDEIHSVEIIGGSSRIPAVKQLIENTFKKIPSTTLNQDEAVARGCAIQCAILSPTFKVRDISITDIQPFPIKMIFDPTSGTNGEMLLFPRFHPIPFSKMITLYRRDPFTLQVEYDADTPFPDRRIGEYTVNNVSATPEGENTKVKIKTKVDLNGLFLIRSAVAYERGEDIEVPVQPEEPMEVENGNTNANGNSQPKQETVEPQGVNSTATTEPSQDNDITMATENAADEPANGQQAETQAAEVKKPVPTIKKPTFKSVQLPVDAKQNLAMPRHLLLTMVEAEAEMVSQDRKEKDRIDVKNGLEEYVYSLRDKLDGEYQDYVTEDDKNKMVATLNDIENWLYEDGEYQERNVYAQKLDELKKFGNGIKEKLDAELRRKMEEEQAKLNPPPAPETVTPAEDPTTNPGKTEDSPSPMEKDGIEIPIHRE